MLRSIAAALFLAASAPFATATASASDRELSLTHVDVLYQDIDGEADGFAIRGSYGFGESNWYVFGDYSRSEIEALNDAHFTMGHLGLGYALPIADPADFVLEGAYQYIRAAGDDLSGYRLGAGVRSRLGTPRVEGHVKAIHYGGGDLESQWAANLGINVFFTDARRFSAIGEYEFGEDGDIYWIGLRATF